MKGDKLPDADHVTRYCGFTQLKPDGTPSGAAFRLRDFANGPEEYLSVNWIELLDPVNRSSAIDQIRTILARKRTMGSLAKLAVINVGYMCSYVHTNTEDSRSLRVLHEPDPVDPSHSGVHGLKLEDELIADLIAQTIEELHTAKVT